MRKTLKIEDFRILILMKSLLIFDDKVDKIFGMSLYFFI